MGNIDERIVKMTFDNSSFEKGVSQTIKSLEKLNEVLKATGNADAVNNISKSMKDIRTQLNNLDFDALNKIEVKDSIWKKIGNALSTAGKGLGDLISKLNIGKSVEQLGSYFSNSVSGAKGLDKTVESITSRFSTLGVIGVTALANITNRVVNLGTNMLKSLTIAPLTTGFSEYETKMNSISTILANTADDGETLESVSAALNELNEYADKTIYNFAQMTDNIGKFTAAGVGLDDSVAAIKGMSNLAAFFGVDATRAAGAMYQMSQALAAGKVQLMDWRSLINAGMSGEAFQKALIRTSEVMGTGAEKMIKKYGSFNESLTKGEWLTADVMIETLKQISGAYKESELRTKGYSATQAKAIVDMAKAADKSATEVRTVTGMFDAMKESIQSGWAISWEHIIGNKEQATETLTAIKDAFEDILGPSTEARNNMLEFWNQNGGRDAVIKGLANVFQSLGKIMGSIGDAWKEVFPPMTGAKLVELSKGFKDFTEKLKVSDSTANKIKNTFKGVFNVFKNIGSTVVSVGSSIVKAFSPLTAVFPAIGNAISSVISAIDKFVTSLSDAVAQSKVFDKIANVIKGAFEGIGNTFTNVSKGFDEFFSYIGGLNFDKAFSFIGKGFKGLGEMLKPVMSGIGKALGTINFDTIMTAMRTGTFLSVLKTLKGTFEEVGGIAESAKGVFKSFSGMGKNIKETLNAAREALEAWQNNLKIETLMKIATAVAVLAASLVLISTIDGAKLAAALGGMAVIMTELSLAYIAMMKYGGVTSIFDKSIAGGIFAIAASVLILAAALKILSSLDAGEMTTSIIGVLSALGALALGVKVLNSVDEDLKRSAASLVIFGVAMMAMAGALKILGGIDSEVLGSGLFALFGLLGELALFLRVAKFDTMGKATGTSMILLATSLLVLSGALKILGGMNAEDITKGLISLAGALAEIVVFSELANESDIMHLATGLVAMSVAIGLLSLAMRAMGSMSWDTIGKGLISMGVSLAIFATAAKSMQELEIASLALGLGLMGASMLIIGSAIEKLGSMSMEQLATGLLGMATALLIMGVAMAGISGLDAMVDATGILIMAAALAILTPQIVALAQLDILQANVALATLAGVLLILGVAGSAITSALPGLLGLAAAIALFGVGAAAAGAGMALFGTGFALVAAAIGASGLLIIEFLRQLINLLPQLGLKAGEAMVNFATAIANGAPQIIAGFSALITAILTAIQQNVPLIAQTAVDIIVAFAQALATGIPQLVTAGCEMILGVLEGIAANIGPIVEAGADVCINFMDGVAEKLPEIIDSGINLALSFIEGVADGISNNKDRLEAAVEKAINAMIDAAIAVITGAFNSFTKYGGDLLRSFCNGIKNKYIEVKTAVTGAIDRAKQACSRCATALVQAGRDLIEGFKQGIKEKAKAIYDAASNVVTGAIDAAKKALKINSPSKVFIGIGKSVDEGFIDGLNAWSNKVNHAATSLSEGVIDNVKNPLLSIGRIINGDVDVNPTITPVLDLSNVERNSRRLGDLLPGNGSLSLTTDKATLMSSSIGQIQNGTDNSDIVSALKDLKASMADNRPSYTVNGITYDDGSNIVNAVESLVRAAKIERRI